MLVLNIQFEETAGAKAFTTNQPAHCGQIHFFLICKRGTQGLKLFMNLPGPQEASNPGNFSTFCFLNP